MKININLPCCKLLKITHSLAATAGSSWVSLSKIMTGVSLVKSLLVLVVYVMGMG